MQRHARALLAIAFVATLGFAAASAITVTQRTDTFALFAERIDIPQQLLVSETRVLPSPSVIAASGTEAAPVEIASGLPLANTAIAKDQWVYHATVRESSPAALTSGGFTVTLLVNGAAVGTIHVAQATPEPDVTEGARLQFLLGPALDSDALYHIEIRPIPRVIVVVAHTLLTDATGPRFLQAGVTNPQLSMSMGETLQLTAKNGDGVLHNIGLKQSDVLIDPPGWSDEIEALGSEDTITWTPTAPGTYVYVCRFHPSTMSGEIVVAA